MTKQGNIYVKIQLEKDDRSGELVIKTQFDPNAPNFIYDKNEISWYPTSEEIEFINDALQLMAKHGIKDMHSVKKERPLSSPEEETGEAIETETTDLASEAEGHETQHPAEPPKMKADAAGIIVASDPKAVEEIIKKKQSGEGVIVEVDEETIVDRVLKQKKRGKW